MAYYDDDWEAIQVKVKPYYVEIVFCKDCKHFISFKYPRIDRCKLIPNKTYQTKHSYRADLSPDIMNRNNDCQNYKRKWWKFWI